MNIEDVLAELPGLTIAERQILVRRALELDESPLSAQEEAVVEQRLADHRRDPSSAVPLEEMKQRLRSRIKK